MRSSEKDWMKKAAHKHERLWQQMSISRIIADPLPAAEL